MIFYVENSIIPTKLLELINVFSKVAAYKINIQKSNSFLYTINKNQTLQVENTILNGIKNNKILGNKYNKKRTRHTMETMKSH